METDLRFGVLTPQDQPWTKEVERWQLIEALGFDSIWVADHFAFPWFEAWTLLAALATSTKEIRIGTLVTNISSRHPAMLARQIVTVDHISKGRLEVGLGAGAPDFDPASYSMLGLDIGSPGELVARFREVIEMLDQLLQKEETTYNGKYYHLEAAMMQPQPIQKPRPPFVIGALGPKMLKITAQYANTWNTFGGIDVSKDEYFPLIYQQTQQMDDYCSQLGRDPKTLRRSVTLNEIDFQSVGAFQDVIGRYREIGFTEFITFSPPVLSESSVFERVATEIIPELKKT